MMNLAEYRRAGARLADYLPWAALVGQGVVLNKDGSFQRSAKFRGPDLDSSPRRPSWSASPAASTTPSPSRLRLEHLRRGAAHEAATYPRSTFPDAASALIDAERKADFEEAARISSRATSSPSSICRRPRIPPRAESWLYEGREQTGVNSLGDPEGLRRSHRSRAEPCSKASCPNAAGSMMPRR
jgi:type IV secretory pathway VirB4 component